MEVYLDNSATTKPFDAVVDLVNVVMTEFYGNPSSLHNKGVEADRVIKKAKKQIADTLNANPNEIFFTSGGTESNNLAILGSVSANKGSRIITSSIEHPATLNTFKYLQSKGYIAEALSVDNKGLINLEELSKLTKYDTALVSIMHVNNEIGTIEPIKEAYRIIKQKNPYTIFHVDAVQSYGKVPLSADYADLISLSSHKIHGPKGVGCLVVREGTRILPVIFGGGQQFNLRSGTENVPGIAGFGLAAAMECNVIEQSAQRMYNLRRKFEAAISKIKGASINTPPLVAAPHILNVSFRGIPSEVLLHHLESSGVYVSSGAACSSHKKSLSYVLTNIGLKRSLIESSIRISLSSMTTEQEIQYAIEKLIDSIEKIYATY